MARTRALSFAETYDGNGNTIVIEKLTCAHCQRIFNKPGPNDNVGFCELCFAAICIPCAKLDKCDPFERKLERMEQRSRLLHSLET